MEIIIRTNKKTRHIWNLDGESREIAQPMADRLGMSLVEFITRLSTRELPDCPKRDEENDLNEPQDVPAGFFLSCTDNELWRRLERAAVVDGTSPELFVWRAVAESIRCIEANIITDPSDGAVLGDATDLWDSCRVVHEQR